MLRETRRGLSRKSRRDALNNLHQEGLREEAALCIGRVPLAT